MRNFLIALVLITTFFFFESEANCNTFAKTASPEEVREFFEKQGKNVLTFLGYSGSGYENEEMLQTTAVSFLEKYDPSQTIVNIGGTTDGIGIVYKLARERGFMTTGIVSSLANATNVPLSQDVMFVFYVQDSSWGGYIDNGVLSATSTAMVENSDVLVAIGGGKVARDELYEARKLGKEIYFIPADMNHGIAIEKTKKRGLAIPKDFTGAAQSLFDNKKNSAAQ